MRAILLNIFNGRIVSPWLVLLIDTVIVTNVFVLSYIVRLNINLPEYSAYDMSLSGFVIVFFYSLAFYLSGSYRGIIRHSSYDEFKIVISSCLGAFVVLVVGNELMNYYNVRLVRLSRLVLIFHFLLSVILCIGFRMFVKELYVFLTRKQTTTRALIFGAGEMGKITLEAIRNDKENEYNIVGFVDDDLSRSHVVMHGCPILSWEKVLQKYEKKSIDVVIMAINNISVQRKHEITDLCMDKGWKLKVMPSVKNWVNGISNQKQIRDIRIEDILGREEINLNQLKIMEGLGGKVILVTGAAGSIGSEIVRQLLRFPIQKIIMVDVAESPLYNLQQELLLSHSDAPFELVLADVTNKSRMEEVFGEYKPQIVFNAAAYKHVPLMESYPYEAIRVNIGGVKVLADLAVKTKVEKFVMISTDKAVNPTNVMGSSKRICEIYIQALSQLYGMQTEFVTTRFGNVLGSNGSVVPLFKRQIERGGPLTVTHKEITRYFMTIPEACQLVLEAGFMGNGGEIFVFDMGEPVKIVDLAKEMIRLSGLKVDEDIKIVYTGLRPGEKLYEELLATKENTKPTHHEKIMIAHVRKHNYTEVNRNLKELLVALGKEKNELLVSRMKAMVPEYKSQNSDFCLLDEKKEPVLEHQR
ncbi:polysaccharide biosynthesis protein [Carboxylicivirga sp. RSCT41]|uniref:polysaccharide biosynthesis protein n=1 Tax=Carboxylicivirga agarovorans TaxID=3417570 RepID=UPI003D336DC9